MNAHINEDHQEILILERCASHILNHEIVNGKNFVNWKDFDQNQEEEFAQEQQI